MIFFFLMACGRPTSSYDVDVYGKGTSLGDIQAASIPMGGYIEYARVRIWGSHIGYGFTGLYGDTPYASGTQTILASGNFAYPPHPSFDRGSKLLTLGPSSKDQCFSIIGTRVAPGSVENIDVGDGIRLKGTKVDVTLPRDPLFYPKPAGDIWYIAYGENLSPVLQNYAHGNDTWPEQAEDLAVSMPGTLPPKETMVGAFPYPVTGYLPIPSSVEGLQINGSLVDEQAQSFVGPWTEDMVLTWAPASTAHPLTVSILLLGEGTSQGACVCDEDCGDGLSCRENECFATNGSSDMLLAEYVCTLSDDGSYTMSKGSVSELLNKTNAKGALLVVSRVAQGEISDIPAVLSHNEKQLTHAPIRTRGIDAIMTRLELP